MVTGANSGIGKACAMAYAKAGGHVYLVCRNRDRANEAQAEIQAATGNQVSVATAVIAAGVVEMADTISR